MNPPATFRCSDEILLRLLVDDDVTERYLAWFQDPEVTRYLDARNITREEALAHIRQGRDTGTFHMYAICLGPSGTHVGNLKVGPINRRDRVSDLVAFVGDRSAWGKGVASTAIAGGGRLAFDVLDFRKLHGGIMSGNIASLRCYSKAGWVCEGVLRAHYLVDGQVYDRILVSCFNPRYFGSATPPGTYPIEEARAA